MLLVLLCAAAGVCAQQQPQSVNAARYIAGVLCTGLPVTVPSNSDLATLPGGATYLFEAGGTFTVSANVTWTSDTCCLVGPEVVTPRQQGKSSSTSSRAYVTMQGGSITVQGAAIGLQGVTFVGSGTNRGLQILTDKAVGIKGCDFLQFGDAAIFLNHAHAVITDSRFETNNAPPDSSVAAAIHAVQAKLVLERVSLLGCQAVRLLLRRMLGSDTHPDGCRLWSTQHIGPQQTHLTTVPLPHLAGGIQEHYWW